MPAYAESSPGSSRSTAAEALPPQRRRQRCSVSLRSYRLPKGMVEPVNLVLTSSLQTIHAVGTQLKPLDKAIDAQPAATLPQTISTVRGLGPVFTSGIVAEIGDIHPFESAPRKLRGRLFSGGADISRVSSRATIFAHQDRVLCSPRWFRSW